MLVSCERLGAQRWRALGLWGVSGAMGHFSMQHRRRWGQWFPFSYSLHWIHTRIFQESQHKAERSPGKQAVAESSLPQSVQPAPMNPIWIPKTSADVLPQQPVVASSRWTSTRWCQTNVNRAGCPAHPRGALSSLFLTHQIFACLIFLIVVLFCFGVVVFVCFFFELTHIEVGSTHETTHVAPGV